jgi:hypothetical protein
MDRATIEELVIRFTDRESEGPAAERVASRATARSSAMRIRPLKSPITRQ